MLKVFHLVVIKTNERMLFRSWEGLQLEKREVKVELRSTISSLMSEDKSLTLVKPFK